MSLSTVGACHRKEALFICMSEIAAIVLNDSEGGRPTELMKAIQVK